MPPAPARPLLRGVAVVCLLLAAVGAVTAHPIVLLEDRSLRVAADGSVDVGLRFHDADRATLTVTDGAGVTLRTTVVDTDRDGSVTVAFDAAVAGSGNATAAFAATSGAVRNATAETASDRGLPPGEYTVSVSPPLGGRDEGTLEVTPGASTATPSASTATPAGTETSADTPDGGVATRPTATPTATPTSPGDGTRLPWPPSLLLALFGPAVPVVVLAGAARLRRE